MKRLGPARIFVVDRKPILAGFPPAVRSKAAQRAFATAIVGQPDGAICLSVGGGPTVVHPRLLNLNIAALPNVDVVATACRLPLPDGSVDAVYCEAVLEHLADPASAVGEMYRVLRRNGQIFAATPFLQSYHAYPDHYQNFTLRGHVRLFEECGFHVVASGACVGPTFTLVDLGANYLREFLPGRLLSRGAFYGARLLGSLCTLFDHVLLRHPKAHLLASTTFVHCFKRS
jgi:SAM-dependent methyltransferase